MGEDDEEPFQSRVQQMIFSKADGACMLYAFSFCFLDCGLVLLMTSGMRVVRSQIRGDARIRRD
jgi:hypothetical protein